MISQWELNISDITDIWSYDLCDLGYPTEGVQIANQVSYMLVTSLTFGHYDLCNLGQSTQ